MPGLALRQPECQPADATAAAGGRDASRPAQHPPDSRPVRKRSRAAIALLDGGLDALAVTARLRRDFASLSASASSAAVTQATLRRRGREKFGADADRLWFTADGLEQATSARRRCASGRALRRSLVRGLAERPASPTCAAASAATCARSRRRGVRWSASTATASAVLAATANVGRVRLGQRAMRRCRDVRSGRIRRGVHRPGPARERPAHLRRAVVRTAVVVS